MDTKELKKGLLNLRDSIEDFLDLMDMDAEEAQPKKKSLDEVKDEFDHPNSKKPAKGKFSSDVEEDEDGKKKEH